MLDKQPEGFGAKAPVPVRFRYPIADFVLVRCNRDVAVRGDVIADAADNRSCLFQDNGKCAGVRQVSPDYLGALLYAGVRLPAGARTHVGIAGKGEQLVGIRIVPSAQEYPFPLRDKARFDVEDLSSGFDERQEGGKLHRQREGNVFFREYAGVLVAELRKTQDERPGLRIQIFSLIHGYAVGHNDLVQAFPCDLIHRIVLAAHVQKHEEEQVRLHLREADEPHSELLESRCVVVDIGDIVDEDLLGFLAYVIHQLFHRGISPEDRAYRTAQCLAYAAGRQGRGTILADDVYGHLDDLLFRILDFSGHIEP